MSNPRISTWKFGVKTSPSGRAFHCKFGCQLLVGVVRHGIGLNAMSSANEKPAKKFHTALILSVTRPGRHGPALPCPRSTSSTLLYYDISHGTVQYVLYCTSFRRTVQYHYDTVVLVQKTVLISCRPLNSISNRIGPPQRLHYLFPSPFYSKSGMLRFTRFYTTVH